MNHIAHLAGGGCEYLVTFSMILGDVSLGELDVKRHCTSSRVF